VPRAAQASGAGGTEPLPFEEAVKKLESIVEAMESEDLPLETLLKRFEEGTRLLRSCQEKLADAEVRVQRLEQDLTGDVVARPFDPAAPDREIETA